MHRSGAGGWSRGVGEKYLLLLIGVDQDAPSAGPPEIAEKLLDAVSPGARVAWIGKDDPACFPASLAARLAGRADVVFGNGGERAWLEGRRSSPRPNAQVLFETRGADGVLVETGSECFEQAVTHMRVSDATGAGDTFAGAVLGVLAGGGSTRSAALAGVEAAAALLALRAG
ncbi:PfkB family carbohydrate kinase [Caulobacter sp. DWR1-3-2b1]|uniref:PfkB family carbohydrate kinase n=1 Tax=Caulobacter sp. DWR1-3-2b1 TaxID=2804670 RepID=UPI003CEF0387